MKKYDLKKLLSLLLVACMMLTVLVQAGCTPEKNEGSTPETTPLQTPSESPSGDESTPLESPTESETEGDESVPPESSEEEGKTETPDESTPPAGLEYKITYDLDGGMNADENPDTYKYEDGDITLFVPVKKGYAFAGWTGTGLTSATEKVTISSGSYGDRAYTATWKEVGNVYGNEVAVEDPLTPDEIAALRDSHKELAANPDILTDPSVPEAFETRGNGVFYAKTAYTDIKVDGVMDNAYTYGLHFELDLPQNKNSYVGVDTNFDAYLIMGQDGKMHVYVNVTDHDIVMVKELWDLRFHHCDVWQMYIDYNADKFRHDDRWDFAAAPDKQYVKQSPKGDWIVVMTENGFAVEYEFDNNGQPFKYGDKFGFSFFYNDSWDYVSTSEYGRSNTRNSSVLVPASEAYQAPDPLTQDVIVITSYPVDHTESIKPEEVTPEKSGDMFKDMASGASNVAVVYGANSSAHTEINAEKLAETLFGLGINATVIREDKVTDVSKYDNVIYVNGAKDTDSTAMINALHYAEYGVRIFDGKIVSVGWQAKANTNITEIIEAVFGYAVSGGDESLIGTYTAELEGIPGANLPKVEGAQWITDSGDDAYVIAKLDTNMEFYEAYKKLVEAAGYTFYTENVIAGVNKNATYYSDDTVINIFYSDAEKDKDLRVSVEPMYNTALPMLKAEEYETVKESSVTLVGPNSLTMIVRLANGEFIVIDSGNRHDDDNIYAELMKLHKSNRPLVIAAWIFTHFHQDHMGGFIDFTLNDAYMKKVTIKSIILNFPEKQVLDTASPGDQVNLGIWPTCIQRCLDQGATLYQARTGQKYYFGNATVEILGTYDDMMPFFVRNDNTNHTCILFCIDIEGQRIMVTGDATTPEFNICAKRYGEYLKSDFLQASHHGYGDGSNDTTFYALVDAPVVLVPGAKETIGTAQKWAADNAKEVYFRSNGTKTLTLPHKIAE